MHAVKGTPLRSQLQEADAKDSISSKGSVTESNSKAVSVKEHPATETPNSDASASKPVELVSPKVAPASSDVESNKILEDTHTTIEHWFQANSSKTLGNLENVRDTVKASFTRFFDDEIKSGAGVSVENPLESFIPYLFTDSDFIKAWSEESKLSVSDVEGDFARYTPILQKAKTSFTDSLKLLYVEAQWRKTVLEKESAQILQNQAKIKSVENTVDVVVHKSCEKFNSTVLNAELKRMITKELPSLLKRNNGTPILFSDIERFLKGLKKKLEANSKVREELFKYKKGLVLQDGMEISFASSFFAAMVDLERASLWENLSAKIYLKFQHQIWNMSAVSDLAKQLEK